jgi:cytochrome d ubiquinol oxidase subunit II
MNALAFAVLGATLVMYVLLDGYDLGVATLGFIIGRNERERGAALESVGPFLNGNEVWLIVAGGILFALFPQAYGSAFSGFYLPFMLVLWLLMFRGIAHELRNHFPSELWHGFWDFAFFGSSALLTLLFGIALGNLLRGVPLDARGYFAGTFAFLLNPFALGVGVFALLALALHGGTFLMFRITGEFGARAQRAVLFLVWPVALADATLTALTFVLRPPLHHSPAWGFAVPLVSLAALAAIFVFAQRGQGTRAFAASSLLLGALLLGAGASMFPYVLPAYPAGTGGLSIVNASPPPVGFIPVLVAVVIGLGAVLFYATLVFRRFTTPLHLGPNQPN